MISSAAVPPPLTPRQRQILQHLADGGSLSSAAQALGININTATKYLVAAREAWGCPTTIALVLAAVAAGQVTAAATPRAARRRVHVHVTVTVDRASCVPDDEVAAQVAAGLAQHGPQNWTPISSGEMP